MCFDTYVTGTYTSRVPGTSLRVVVVPSECGTRVVVGGDEGLTYRLLIVSTVYQRISVTYSMVQQQQQWCTRRHIGTQVCCSSSSVWYDSSRLHCGEKLLHEAPGWCCAGVGVPNPKNDRYPHTHQLEFVARDRTYGALPVAQSMQYCVPGTRIHIRTRYLPGRHFTKYQVPVGVRQRAWYVPVL